MRSVKPIETSTVEELPLVSSDTISVTVHDRVLVTEPSDVAVEALLPAEAAHEEAAQVISPGPAPQPEVVSKGPRRTLLRLLQGAYICLRGTPASQLTHPLRRCQTGRDSFSSDRKQ